MNRISRKIEMVELKNKIAELIKELGVSKHVFKRTLPRVKKFGYEYKVDDTGHKPSIRQQYSLLLDLVKFNNEKKDKEMVK